MYTAHFMAGMPRSGSTLLCSILNQHPDIYASSTSPLATVMWNTQETILNSPEYKSYQETNCLKNSVSSIVYNYYNFRNKSHIIDKNRMWGTPGNIDLMVNYSKSRPKVICTVRPILEILTSYISIIKDNEEKNNSNFIEYKSLNEKYEAFCDFFMSYDGEIYNSMWSLKNLINSNKIDCLVVPYKLLISDHDKVSKELLNFLNVDSYIFDFSTIKNINEGYELETDIKYHQVRSEISLKSSDINDILSDRIIKKYQYHGIPILETEKIERF